MGILFRKRVKILPGVHINVSKSGLGLNVGVPGANITLNKRGTTLNTGIPGTGIYSREKLSGNRNSRVQTQKQSDSEIINQNPLRFIVIFLSFLLAVAIPTIGNGSWWFFPGFIISGIALGCLIPSKNNEHISNNLESVESAEESIESTETTQENELNKNTGKEDSDEERCFIDKMRLDPLFEDAARLIVIHQQGSTSLIQRKLAIGYNRSGRIMDQLECAGIVGESSGAKARDVFCRDENELEHKLSHLEQAQFDRLYLIENEEQEESNQQEIFNESSRLIKLGIDLEKEGMIDEAISVYEKSIIPQLTATHPYDRLMILYRKKKDYNNEIRVIKIAISVFMKENERRAGRSIEEDSSLYNQVIQALEENKSIKYEDGKYAFVQCNVMDYITRLEKAKRLSERTN